MGRRMPAGRVMAPLLASLTAVLLCACGGDDDDVASSPTMPTAAAIVDPAASAQPAPPDVYGESRPNPALPDLQVVRVASHETVALRTLAPLGTPMVLWFWAPHCTLCRGEAPELLEFEKTYGTQLTILGLGAQDDYEQAVDFLADTGTQNLEMVWDKTGKSWRHFKVTNQPAVVVVDADGRVTKRWFRDFDARGILDAAGVA